MRQPILQEGRYASANAIKTKREAWLETAHINSSTELTHDQWSLSPEELAGVNDALRRTAMLAELRDGLTSAE